MKVAYHFKCTEIEGRYDSLFYKLTFTSLLNLKEPFISSKVLIGDLIKHEMIRKFDNPNDFLNHLFQAGGDTWKRILPEKVKYFVEQDLFIICFETLQKEVEEKIH